MLAELHNAERKAEGTSGQALARFLSVAAALFVLIAKGWSKDGLSLRAM